MLVTGPASLVANYTKIYEPNPVGEVAIAMANGTVIWAMTNLSGNGTFAQTINDFGALFQWGYSDAIPNSTSGVSLPHSVGQSATIWPESENPCPMGWRVPTRQELSNLINKADGTYSSGKPDGPYTTITWANWGDGSGNDGMKIIPVAGDTGKTLYLPNAGYRNYNGTTLYRGDMGLYWANKQSDRQTICGYRMSFQLGIEAGFISDEYSKLNAYSVRCVR